MRLNPEPTSPTPPPLHQRDISTSTRPSQKSKPSTTTLNFTFTLRRLLPNDHREGLPLLAIVGVFDQQDGKIICGEAKAAFTSHSVYDLKATSYSTIHVKKNLRKYVISNAIKTTTRTTCQHQKWRRSTKSQTTTSEDIEVPLLPRNQYHEW